MISLVYSKELNKDSDVNEIVLQGFYMKLNVLSDIYLLVIPCLILIAVCGCKNKETLRQKNVSQALLNETKASSGHVITLVRSIVMKRGQGLSEEEKKIILRSIPEVAQYKMAGTAGQYVWSWKLTTGRAVGASYLGNLEQVDTDKMVVFYE